MNLLQSLDESIAQNDDHGPSRVLSPSLSHGSPIRASPLVSPGPRSLFSPSPSPLASPGPGSPFSSSHCSSQSLPLPASPSPPNCFSESLPSRSSTPEHFPSESPPAVYEIDFEHRRPLEISIDNLIHSAVLPKIKTELQFISLIREASLDDTTSNLSNKAIYCLQNPPQSPITIENNGIRHSIAMYLALEHLSQAAYDQICHSTRTNCSESPASHNLLSFHGVEKKIAEYTGIEHVEYDMCPESCIGFTGPFSELEACPICATSHWDPGCLHASNG